MAAMVKPGLLLAAVLVLGSCPTLHGQDSPAACPAGCYCDERKAEVPASLKQKGFESWLRINCHPIADADPASILAKLPANTLHLDLAKYGLTELEEDAFASAPHLQVRVA